MKALKFKAAFEKVTKDWTKQKIREVRDRNARASRYRPPPRTSQKELVATYIEEAYLKASDNDTLPANARQVMYAIRPFVLEEDPNIDPTNFATYFLNTLLDEYLDEYQPDWGANIERDARGHFTEPHTTLEVPLGTFEVASYLSDVRKHKVEPLNFNVIEDRYPTYGPKGDFGALLYIEKEGFLPLFERAKLGERYDLAIMSSKGQSVRAARMMADYVCGKFGVQLFTLHDFDKAGFSIKETVQTDSIKYKFTHAVEAIDLGLRLDDVKKLHLEDLAEPVTINGSYHSVCANLRGNGATKEEIDFLVTGKGDGKYCYGQRVELNAMTSRQFLDFVERKLKEHNVQKLVPDQAKLEEVYRREWAMHEAQARLDAMIEERSDLDPSTVPGGLAAKVRRRLSKKPDLRWDGVIRELVQKARAK